MATPAPPAGAAQLEAAMVQLLVSHTQTSLAARVQLKEALRQGYCAAALLFLVQHSARIEVSWRAGCHSAFCPISAPSLAPVCRQDKCQHCF